jgi:hypothetical protein
MQGRHFIDAYGRICNLRSEPVSFLENVCCFYRMDFVDLIFYVDQLITTTKTSLATTDWLPLLDDRFRWRKHTNTSLAYKGGVYQAQELSSA